MKKSSLVSELADYWSAPATTPQLPVWRQVLEMVVIYLLRRMGPRYYLQARWGRAFIPFSDKWNHINSYEYRRLIHQRNPTAYQKVSAHKLIEKSVLTLQNLPTPKFIALAHPLRGRCAKGKPVCNAVQLSALLTDHIGERICFKPVEGYGGFGFASYRIVLHDGAVSMLRAEGGPLLRPDTWWQSNGTSPGGYLLEAYLEQHPAMAALNPSSVNTVRLWTALQSDQWQPLGAYLRIGRHGSQVDNNSSGGIACPIDVASGRIREAFDPAKPALSLQQHPDSHISLVGFQIPYWNEATTLAGHAVAAFPHMKIAGLDIATTPNGPCIIELNVMADHIGCAWMDLPLKARLKHLNTRDN
jgi:hypothetical protein